MKITQTMRMKMITMVITIQRMSTMRKYPRRKRMRRKQKMMMRIWMKKRRKKTKCLKS